MVDGKALDTREFPGFADATQTVRRGPHYASIETRT
jgi:hypothetical protein